jgi:hypothetical protein
VTEKRPVTIFAHVIAAAGSMLPGRKYPVGLLQSANAVVQIELQRIGFSMDEINKYSASQKLPPFGLIEDRIKNFDITKSPFYQDAPWGPLTADAYYQCFTFLGAFKAVKEAAVENDYRGRNLFPYQWISIGIQFGWQLQNIGLDTMGDISESVRAELRAERRKGKTYSVARIAIKKLIGRGIDTGNKVKSYLEENDLVDGTSIRVTKECDKWGNTTAYVFFDESLARTGKLELSSLAATVSNLKKRHFPKPIL